MVASLWQPGNPALLIARLPDCRITAPQGAYFTSWIRS